MTDHGNILIADGGPMTVECQTCEKTITLTEARETSGPMLQCEDCNPGNQDDVADSGRCP